ncbi:D-methionine transport system ATP-binding protein [Orbus hercynius]|uniref:Cell division ATP-binding protein FtsE n=1 Tax=Orbus hercynius TaxID=593135 RepID=A0A495RJ36_9GAMM|nr:methionine ABC transporter ATP-binding protein [Orbus hercynius]RKS87379.1 D-methionine transport system ATP-binding protein [Orbus hercynius]
MIKLDNIDVIFNDNHNQTLHAVNEVSLSVNKGEIFGIVGYSGAGKSTLVRVINLLQKPNFGNVMVDGQNLLNLSPSQLRQARKKIGMIFQHFNLMNSRTVYGNVLYPLRDSSLSSHEKAQKIAQLLELVGLADKRDFYPAQLSGGQKQRVAIARALANDPHVLLCDEATSALDPKTTQSILKLLKELNQRLNLTIVLITHEMQVVKEICHRVAVMEHGKVVEQNDIVSIFSHPAQRLTQDFIRTASNIEQAYDAIFNHPQLAAQLKHQNLFELRFAGNNHFQPFISQLYAKYHVETTILYSHLEIIQHQPVGHLIVILHGSDPAMVDAESFLNQHNIAVSRLNALQNDNYYSI